VALEAGRKFHAALTNGLAQKKTFEAVCADEKVTPIGSPVLAHHPVRAELAAA